MKDGGSDRQSENNRNTPAEAGGSRYLVLGFENPLLTYGCWTLFVLLVIRLCFVGFAGVLVPEVGETATSYYVAPRTLSCDKPNPNFDAMVAKVKSEVNPVYSLRNAHFEARDRLLKSTEVKIAADLEGLRQLDRQLRELESGKGEEARPVKESPFLHSPGPTAAEEAEKDKREATRHQLKENRNQTAEHAKGQILAIAPDLTKQQQGALLDLFKQREDLMTDSFRAAGVALDEVRKWIVVEARDPSFTVDQGRGIRIAQEGSMLDPTTRVYSLLEAWDQVRGGLVAKVISENFPKLKKWNVPEAFVTRIIINSVKANFHRDERKSKEVLDEMLSKVPQTVSMDFNQGQTIVALGEKVEDWQASCISRFAVKTVGRAGLGNIMGVPLPSLFLFLGIALLLLGGALALRGFAVRVFNDRRLVGGDYLAIGVALVMHLALVRLFLFGASVFSLNFPAVSKSTMLTASPVAMAAMLVCVLLGVRAAFLAMLFVLLATSVIVVQSGPEMLSGDFPPYYMLYVVSVTLTGMWLTRKVTRRGGFFRAGMGSALVGLLFWGVVYLIEGGQVPWNHLGQLVVATLASGALSYILLISLAPLFEYLWDYTTDSRLIELSSSEHPALKELSKRAPGTYQHSLWLATLVEEAAETIGANALLAKVGAYYHDLGKLAAAAEMGLPKGGTESPLFFAENQAMGTNPHDHLPPVVSARVVKKHVELSIKMIRKYRLGKKLEDIAAQHHGTSLIEHFYNRALADAEATHGKVEEADFRYPGLRPQSKEAALVMLGDTVEAAVRALPQHSEESIRKRVEELVKKRRTDGQLDESSLTFGDVKKVEGSFIKTLISMYHARPEYLRSRQEESTVRIDRPLIPPGSPAAEESDTQRLIRRGVLDSLDEEESR
jgi:putative nucleotidyltransferase with HDIG domain